MFEGKKIMALNKGYLTAKTDKASDEVYTPAYAVKPILKYIDKGNNHNIVFGALLTKKKVNLLNLFVQKAIKLFVLILMKVKISFIGNPKNIMII